MPKEPIHSSGTARTRLPETERGCTGSFACSVLFEPESRYDLINASASLTAGRSMPVKVDIFLEQWICFWKVPDMGLPSWYNEKRKVE